MSRVTSQTVHTPHSTHRGFTLIEILVSLAMFSVVMLIATTAMLRILDADKKAEALKSVLNNLNFALESMSREARIGSVYHCGLASDVTINTTVSCASGNTLFAFATPAGPTYAYRFYTTGGVTHLQKSENSGSTYSDIVASNVVIDAATSRFFVTNADGVSGQPKVQILVHGYVQPKLKLRSDFTVQTSVTARPR